ncbi:hypothetical protein ZIOFF_001274 [Zingiber officinale]|uniref:Amine oxidase domain-containing protein n=1 Tax=Zingiber officinale TaxID=94328 RepID=A0A8J5IJM8_ZINOF|nr:hypothetical protein ZIOFF_001274 [Zingiber officinale]
MRVAVVGAGISGLAAAYTLVKAGVEVVLYEKEDYLGGHAKTVSVDGLLIDLGFMVFNQVTYPNMIELFESLGLEMETADMSFAVSLDDGKGYEWGTRNGFSSLFAQKTNIFNPYFLQMIREILKFKDDVFEYLEELDNNRDKDRSETLEHFIVSHGYSELFQKGYLIPVCASIWSCPSERVLYFSAYSILSFCRNHHLLQLFGSPQWLTVKSRSQCYVDKIREELESRSCTIKTGCAVQSIFGTDTGCCVVGEDCSKDIYDGCIISTQAPDALKLLGEQATFEEARILGAFQYVYSYIYLHHDKSFMPQNPATWSAWNFLGTTQHGVCITYWLNVLQNLHTTKQLFLVTLNPKRIPKHSLLKWCTRHLLPSVAASKASLELENIQGKRRIWFSGVYQGYDFHEDALKAGVAAANNVVKNDIVLLRNPKHMVPSLMECGARFLVNRFLTKYIAIGCVTLLEEGGNIYIHEGATTNNTKKAVLRVHNSLFYWKIAIDADIGLADAYINGYLSFVDKENGLLDLFLVLIANMELRNTLGKSLRFLHALLSSGVSSARYFFRHSLRQNTITQAHRNISSHYDLSNEFFNLFLDETMTYSCAIFKTQNEDLKTAQLRKISLLIKKVSILLKFFVFLISLLTHPLLSSSIKKAQVEGKHEVLDIGCGWGSLAIELVKQTGCKYTGITLSKEQLTFAKRKAKEAGLEDYTNFMLMDYRQLPKYHKYDRIISCYSGMIEGVGHEYIDDFFGCCESLLSTDGILVLQFISIPDQRYDEYRRSSDFIKEYIFPGGCIPSLNRITTAMATSSKLCIEHIENIGIHYYQTLICWRNNLLANKDKIIALGFDEKFVRTWEYYFIYCASGFKSCTLEDYQIVFSRPGNVGAFGEPFKFAHCDG